MEQAVKKLLRQILIVLGLLGVLCGILLYIIWDDVFLTQGLLHLQCGERAARLGRIRP